MVSSKRCAVDIDIPAVLSQNITLVYDSLDLQTIDSSKLKELTDAKAMVMDTPEMIVAVYPAAPIIIQMGDGRTRVTLQRESEDIGSVPLWEIALKCNRLAPKSALVAYGFNYDVAVEFAGGNAHTIMTGLFVSDPQRIENALEGHLLSSIPRLKFRRGQTLYDLVLEPINEQHIKAHLNAHFEFEGISLPSQDQLEAFFRQEFEYLISVLSRLFEGDE